MTDKLKPCPFCGGKASLYVDKFENYFTGCEVCDFYLGIEIEHDCELRHGFLAKHYSKESAIEAWNTRKPMDRIVEQLEKWKQEADEQYEDTDSELYKMASVGKYHAYKQAIEIVKEGGKDE